MVPLHSPISSNLHPQRKRILRDLHQRADWPPPKVPGESEIQTTLRAFDCPDQVRSRETQQAELQPNHPGVPQEKPNPERPQIQKVLKFRKIKVEEIKEAI